MGKKSAAFLYCSPYARIRAIRLREFSCFGYYTHLINPLIPTSSPVDKLHEIFSRASLGVFKKFMFPNFFAKMHGKKTFILRLY